MHGKRSLDLTDKAAKIYVNLFQVPSGRVLYGITCDASLDESSLVPLLEDFYYESVEITLLDGELVSLIDLVSREIATIFPGSDWSAEPDLHQILFPAPNFSGFAMRNGEGLAIREDLLRSLVYRVQTAQREGFTSIQFPAELNRSQNTIAAVGSFVSVLCGHQDYVENAAIISAVAVIAATTELRATQELLLRSYQVVRDRIDTMSHFDRRRMLSSISGQLARHEMNLSQHVESVADIGLWVPSLRVEDYHRNLVSSVRLVERSEIIARSIQRLTSIASARTQVLIAEEQQLNEHRRRSWALVVGLLTTVAVPTSFILAFFGVSASEVVSTKSIFDLNQYLGVYLFAFGMVGISILAVSLFWLIGHPNRKSRNQDFEDLE